MIRFGWLAALGLVLCSVSVSAQTTTQKLEFQTPDALAFTAGVTYALQVNTAAPVNTQATCVAGSVLFPTGATCQLPLPMPVVKGDVLKLLSTNAGGSVTVSFTDPGVPGTPSGFKLIFIVTVP